MAVNAIGSTVNEKLRKKSPKLASSSYNQQWKHTQWMGKYQHLKITDLYIPGSHDSATYSINGLGSEWSRAQSLNILQQLNVGIRFLDFRVMSKNNTIYVSHRFQGGLFEDCLVQIKRFLSVNKTEIVLMEVKKDGEHNPLDLNKAHEVVDLNKVNNLIVKILGDCLVKTQEEKIIGKLTYNGTKGRVILLGNDMKSISPYVKFTYTSNWNKYNAKIPNEWYKNQQRFLISNDYMSNDFLAMIGECTPDVAEIAQSYAAKTGGIGAAVSSAFVDEQWKDLRDLAAATNYQLRGFLQKEQFPNKKLIITHDYVNHEIIQKILSKNEAQEEKKSNEDEKSNENKKIYQMKMKNQMIIKKYTKNQVYAIRSISSGNYLDGRAGEKNPLLGYRDKDPAKIKYLHWKCVPLKHGLYALKSVSSQNYLDGRAGEHNPLLGYKNRDPDSIVYLRWRIVINRNFLAIKSESSGNYLDGRAGEKNPLLGYKNRFRKKK
eukprot:281100_1